MNKQLDLFDDPNYSRGAEFSLSKSFRYVLWRVWDHNKPKIMFIGLNPSKADSDNDDPTIKRVVSFAKQWGYGGVFMLNLFTLIGDDPKILRKAPDRERKADKYLSIFHYMVDTVVFAWGNFSESKERARRVIKMFPEAYCLKKNKDGSPRHPLYVKDGTQLIKFNS